MNEASTPVRDIERWLPSRWDQIVGNQPLKEYFWDMIMCVRKEGHRSGFNLLLTGPSRGGKTSGITLGIQALGCFNLDLETFNPCGRCANCTAKIGLYGNDGWENWVDLFEDEETAKRSVRFLYIPLNCGSLNEAEIDRLLDRVRVDDGTLKIVYLDEVHRLVRRGLDSQLLVPLEKHQVIWMASSAYVRRDDNEDAHEGRPKQAELEKMFQNRFTYRITTQPATIAEMAVWLAERCAEWCIRVTDPEPTLTRLAERSRRLPGMALQVVNKAHKRRSKTLTRQMVEDHTFDVDA
jgi:hypothetical protein